MNKTNIEWVKNPDGSQGYTWNPITGCLNHDNGLCKGGGFPCYAYRLANGRLKSRYLANMNCPTTVDFRNGQYRPDADAYLAPFYPRFWEERLEELRPIGGLVCELVYPPKTSKGIFVCDMGDLFGIGIPEDWTRAVLHMINKWPAHRFYLLTKQPQNLITFSPFPENCWVGVTVTSHEYFVEACRRLAQIKSPIKYISFEPLLTRIAPENLLELYGINWIILGAQTKPYKPPKIEWVREIVEAADKAGIPVFLKDNLRPLLIPEDCNKPNYLTEDIFWASEKAQLRQEMP